VQSERKMRGKMELDLMVDLPPDLALEVEITRSSISKMPIYAALGVPELWRYDGQILRIYELIDGHYMSRDSSVCFPNFPIAKCEEVLQQAGHIDDTSLVRGFQQWVRETMTRAADQ
jgi:hypothetical protein